MTIRKMVPADRDEVLAMMRTFYASPAVLSNGSEEIFEADFSACVSENPYLEGLIFESDGVLAGYSMLAHSFSTEFGKPCVWVEDLYLKPEFRHKGVGTEFFGWLSERYKGHTVRLEAEHENENAVSLYRKSGFEELLYMELIKQQ